MHAVHFSGGAGRLGRDRGAAALLVVVVALAIGGAALVATVHVAEPLVAANRARTAADAAALAGVVHGRPEAERVAAANGGVLVGWSDAGDTVSVEVRVGPATSTARATNAP